jgi:RNA polymerase sigma-70 factor (ECF subfamily)
MAKQVLSRRTRPTATSRAGADERLRVEAAQRDPNRFGDLYEQHFEQVYAFIGRRLRDRAETEDVTSEVFRRALSSLKKYEWRGTPFAAWLLRIAGNAVTDRWKRNAREKELANSVIPAPPATREIALSSERARLYRLVNGLPGEQRRVIVLRFAEEKDVSEIAEEMGRSEGAVRQLQFRALEKLRAELNAKAARKSGKNDG